MLIDWFTVIAQIVNFLILIWLLRRFLYRPITEAMQAREARITARLAEADHKLDEARQAAARYERLRAELDENREGLLHEARQAAEAERRELLHAAREDFQRAQQRWRELLEQEQAAFRQELRRRAGEQTLAVTRRALADLANADLERQMVATFLQRLDGLDKAARQALADACRDGQPGLRVVTAFELPPEVRDGLARALRERLSADCEVRFETAPEVVCGLELRSDGHKLAWSLDSYLDELETRVTEALSSPT